jgi:hypothetical protein
VLPTSVTLVNIGECSTDEIFEFGSITNSNLGESEVRTARRRLGLFGSFDVQMKLFHIREHG